MLILTILLREQVDSAVRHVSLQLEYCFTRDHTGTRWIWCVDYNGFGITHALQGRMAARFALLFANHMPERLHKVILLNPPRVFQIMLKAVSAIADPVTMSKLVAVTGSPETVIETLETEHYFPASSLCWLKQVLELAPTPETPLPPLPAQSKDLVMTGMRAEFKYKES